MTTTTTPAGTAPVDGDEALPSPLTPAEELAKLRLILGHVGRLSAPSKRWLRDRLDAELTGEGRP